jgi:predicted dehydrogenase
VTNLNDFIGPKGTLQFGDTRSKKTSSFDPKIYGAFTLKKERGSEKLFKFRKNNMFLEQTKHVVRCFSNNEQPLVKAADAIAALHVANAVLRSGRTKRTINL